MPREKPFDPWMHLPYGLHLEAMHFVRHHPEGAALSEVGRTIGLTKERVRQIAISGLRKYQAAMDREGEIDTGTVLKFVKERREIMGDLKDKPVVKCHEPKCLRQFRKEHGRTKYCWEHRRGAGGNKGTVRARRNRVDAIAPPDKLLEEVGYKVKSFGVPGGVVLYVAMPDP